MLARDLVERVAERAAEVVVGRDDAAVQRELDHGLHLADRFHLASKLAAASFASVMSVAYLTTLNGLPFMSRIGNGKPFKVVKYATDITAEKVQAADFAGSSVPSASRRR